VAEWLRNGLQNRVPRFNSGRGLHPSLAQRVKAAAWLVKGFGATKAGRRELPRATARRASQGKSKASPAKFRAFHAFNAGPALLYAHPHELEAFPR
jgi:hypothetical protein